jgi:hypothetical protein
VIAGRRRAMLAEGRARDPDFVLSKAEYDTAAEGNWTVRVDGAGQFTVEHALGGANDATRAPAD